ncbi:MAG TPA: hypothetical protein PLQ06_03550 [Bacteroidales bacterium]|nr:hypothetical protein [Bacteroidales bacterium]HPJ58780.1 hypothetical protein [Bacteroidales bacterium]
MVSNPQIHNRRSIRLRGYDYTGNGAYFITVCVHDRKCLFGEIVNDKMHLNEFGRIVDESWKWLSTQYDYVELDEMIVMPDHLHGIIIITDHPDNARRGDSRIAPTTPPQIAPTSPRIVPTTSPQIAPTSLRIAPTTTLPDIAPVTGDSQIAPTTIKRKTIGRLIGAFKTVSTKHINQYNKTPGNRVWQRNYYERIIRDAAELNRVRDYIMKNVSTWLNNNDDIYGKTKQ